MFKSYFIVAWRNLIRNKTLSILNILGLMGGTICCLYILLYVQEQYSFDKHHQDVDRIFRITTDIISSDKTDKVATTSPVIIPAIREDFPEVEEAVRVVNRSDVNEHLFRTGEKSFYVTNGYYADSTFFNVFTYRFTEGLKHHCIDQPLSMVVSSTVAKQLFGNERALNKTITMTDRFGTNDYTITAVFDEESGRSHMRPNFIVNINSGRLGGFIRKDQNWAWSNYAYGYVKLKPGTDAKAFEGKLSSYVAKKGNEQLVEAGYKKAMHLQPIQDIHVFSNLNLEIDKNSNAKFLIILMIIAAFIQLIACINFMNLSTARSAARAKEIGVRKSAGAGKSAIIWQFLNESLLVTIIAIGLSIPVLQLLLPYFNAISQYALSNDILGNIVLWKIVIALIIITSLLAGSYPAFYLSSFKAIEVVKGNFRHHLSVVSLRKGLVVFQFVISVGLIISALIIRNQVKYMQVKDLGFNQEQKLIIPIRSRDAILNMNAFKNEVAKLAEINSVAGVAYNLGFKITEDIDLYKRGQVLSDAKQILYNQSDENYFEMMGIPVVAGRNFTRADTLDRVIINETAAKELGLNVSEAPGQNLYCGSDNEMRTFLIVGVIKDFNFASLHEPIKPIFFRYNTRFPNLVVSSRSSDYSTLISKLEIVWKQFSSEDPFEYSFLDQSLQMQYETENTLIRIINSFTLLAIFICCLGLFGLAAFTAEQRKKEIGIRKVLGASVQQIVVLLSKDFLRLVLIAFVIVIPISWYGMNQWLQTFAYRIDFNFVIAAVAGCGVVLIALLTISYQSIKAAMDNPVESLRSE